MEKNMIYGIRKEKQREKIQGKIIKITKKYKLTFLIKLIMVKLTKQVNWYNLSPSEILINGNTDFRPLVNGCTFLKSQSMDFYTVTRNKNDDSCVISYWSGTGGIIQLDISEFCKEITRVGETNQVIIGTNSPKSGDPINIDLVKKDGASLKKTTYEVDPISPITSLDNDDIHKKTIISFENRVIGFYDFTQTVSPWRSSYNLRPAYEGVEVKSIERVRSLEDQDFFAAVITKNGKFRVCVYPIPESNIEALINPEICTNPFESFIFIRVSPVSRHILYGFDNTMSLFDWKKNKILKSMTFDNSLLVAQFFENSDDDIVLLKNVTIDVNTDRKEVVIVKLMSGEVYNIHTGIGATNISMCQWNKAENIIISRHHNDDSKLYNLKSENSGCPDNCLNCNTLDTNNPKRCLICENGYYPTKVVSGDPNLNGGCSLCQNNKIVENFCTDSCPTELQVQISNGKCLSCSKYWCSECDSNDVCTKRVTGFDYKYKEDFFKGSCPVDKVVFETGEEGGILLGGFILCNDCPKNCTSCSSAVSCSSCDEGFDIKPGGGLCLRKCNESEFRNEEKNECEKCSEKCLTCSSKEDNACITCPSGKELVEGRCLEKCDGERVDGKCENGDSDLILENSRFSERKSSVYFEFNEAIQDIGGKVEVTVNGEKVEQYEIEVVKVNQKLLKVELELTKTIINGTFSMEFLNENSKLKSKDSKKIYKEERLIKTEINYSYSKLNTFFKKTETTSRSTVTVVNSASLLATPGTAIQSMKLFQFFELPLYVDVNLPQNFLNFLEMFVECNIFNFLPEIIEIDESDLENNPHRVIIEDEKATLLLNNCGNLIIELLALLLIKGLVYLLSKKFKFFGKVNDNYINLKFIINFMMGIHIDVIIGAMINIRSFGVKKAQNAINTSLSLLFLTAFGSLITILMIKVKKEKEKWSFLWEDLKEKLIFWKKSAIISQMAKDFLVVFFIMSLIDVPFLQIFLILIIFTISLIFNVKSFPFKKKRTSIMMMITDICFIGIYACFLLILIFGPNKNELFGVVLILLTSLAILSIILTNLIDIFYVAKNFFDKRKSSKLVQRENKVNQIENKRSDITKSPENDDKEIDNIRESFVNLNNLDFGEKEEEKINIEENEGLPNEEDREINRPKFRDERQRRRRRKGNKEKTNNQEKIKKERKRKKKKKNNGDGLNFERDGELEI